MNSPEKPTPPFPAIGTFLFGAALYAQFRLADREELELLFEHPDPKRRVTNFFPTRMDGYCPYCKKESTFTLRRIKVVTEDLWLRLDDRTIFEQLGIFCARETFHEIKYNIRISKMIIQKIGQYPSLADIAIDETRQKYRSVLKGDNWAEFYKAIGLAAHGEGIGSFLYLRRVFERLIFSRFKMFKAAENWRDEDFYPLRMDEKIQFLKAHLPPYLVEIRKIYSIFSRGIHELDNSVCLDFFEVGKRSIVIVLEDDIKHTEELQARRDMAAAVAKFSEHHTPSAETEDPNSGNNEQA